MEDRLFNMVLDDNKTISPYYFQLLWHSLRLYLAVPGRIMSEELLLLRNQCKPKDINIRIKVEINIQLISQDLKAPRAQFEAYKWKETKKSQTSK